MTGLAAVPPAARGVEIDADLAFSVSLGGDSDGDGHRGQAATGWLNGTGGRLHLQVDRPDVLVAATGRRAGAALAEQLVAAGVRAEVHGPRGRVAVLDPHLTSRTGALLTGSPHVVLDPPGWGVLARAALVAPSGGVRRRGVPTGAAGLPVAIVVGIVITAAVVRRCLRRSTST